MRGREKVLLSLRSEKRPKDKNKQHQVTKVSGFFYGSSDFYCSIGFLVKLMKTH